LKYVFCIKEDRYTEEEVQAGGDRRQAKAGRCAGLTGIEHGGRDPSDRGQRGGLRDELLNGEIFCTLSQDYHRELAPALQRRPATRFYRLQTTSHGDLRARLHRVAGFATSTGFAGHAGAIAALKLTFHLDHSIWARHVPPALSLPG
jgi:hypothetical protein